MDRELKQKMTNVVLDAGFKPEWKIGKRHLKMYVGETIVAVLSYGKRSVSDRNLNNYLTTVRRNVARLKESKHGS